MKLRTALVAAAISSMVACAEPDTDVLHVFAASSLRDAFQELGEEFELRHGVAPRLTFAGSQVLRLQIEQGAPADVFASADLEHMSTLVEGGFVTPPTIFAHNALALITSIDTDSLGFTDLTRVQSIVVGTPDSPIGRYTKLLLDRAAVEFGDEFRKEVEARVVSNEANVRLVRAKVELGEADAAFVYRSDAIGAGARVRSVPVPSSVAVRAEYAVASVRSASANPSADQWAALLTSEEGRGILRRHGFDPA